MRDFLISLACLSWLIFFVFSTQIGRETFKVGAWGLGAIAVVGMVAFAGGAGYYAGQRAERAEQGVRAAIVKAQAEAARSAALDDRITEALRPAADPLGGWPMCGEGVTKPCWKPVDYDPFATPTVGRP